MGSSKKTIIVAMFIGLVLIGWYIFNTIQSSSRGTRASIQATKTFTPSLISLTDPEIVSSNRGLYKWRGGEVVPIGDGVNHNNTSQDTYDRFTWNELETTDGQYTFTEIKAKAAEARARGGKFGFGIYTFCTSYCDDVSVPADIATNRGTYGGASLGNRYVPDWNNANFLNRVERMLMRLSQEMQNDREFGESIGYVEIRIYGNWGEWHMFGASGFPRITEASQKHIVDMHARAFPGKQLVMMSNGHYAAAHAMDLGPTSNPPVSQPIGWRNDCLGLHENNYSGTERVVEHFRSMVLEPVPADPGPENVQPPADDAGNEDWDYKNYWKAVAWSKMKERWKTAPVVTEFCPLYPDRKLEANLSGTPVPVAEQISEVQAAINQTKDFHVAYISNGNIGSYFWYDRSRTIGGTNAEKWNAFSQVEKDKLFLLGKTAGYRFELRNLTWPAQLVPGTVFISTANWINVGVAPQYEAMETQFELRNPTTGAIVWKSIPSSVNFQTLLPSGSVSAVQDTFTLPATILVGQYDVYVIVNSAQKKVDGTPYRKPMGLAIAGKQADGSYKLGVIEVVTTTTNPSVTATLTPTASLTATMTVSPTATPSTVPTSSITPSPTPIASQMPTGTITILPSVTMNPTGTIMPTNTPNPACPLQPRGDANCDGKINDTDYDIWRNFYKGQPSTGLPNINSDFNGDGKIDLKDFEIWRRNRE